MADAVEDQGPGPTGVPGAPNGRYKADPARTAAATGTSGSAGDRERARSDPRRDAVAPVEAAADLRAQPACDRLLRVGDVPTRSMVRLGDIGAHLEDRPMIG
jgi:hypothetical protein